MNLNQDQQTQLTFFADELEAGHYDQVLLFFETVQAFADLLPSLVTEPRFRVRAGAHLLIEELIAQGRDLSPLALELEDFLQDEQDYIRGEAISALEALGTPRQLALLQPFIIEGVEPYASLAKDAREGILARFPA